jgi:hypothetical protein
MKKNKKALYLQGLKFRRLESLTPLKGKRQAEAAYE